MLKKKIIPDYIKYFFVLLLLGSMFASTVHAQQPNLNLTISPTLLDISVDPGSSLHQTFRIRNNSTQPITLHVTVDKLSTDNITGQVIPIKAQPGDSSLSWVSFDKSTVTALPEEWTDFSFTLTVPKDAAFGYYYALRIGQSPDDIKGHPNAKVLGEIILPLLVNVKNANANATMRLLSFIPGTFINETLPVTFDVNVSNKGNIHLKPHGNIFVTSGEHTLDTLDVNPGLGNVLPGSERTFSASWDNGFLTNEPVLEDGVVKLDNNHHPITHLVIHWNRLTDFRIGKYTAHLLMVYDNGKKDVALEATTTFWVIPWRFLLIVIAGLVLVLFGVRLLLKWHIAREIRKYHKA